MTSRPWRDLARIGLLSLLLVLLCPPVGSSKELIFDPGDAGWKDEVKHTDHVLDRLVGLGADTLRLRVSQADPRTEQLDYAVHGAKARGLDVMLVGVGPAPSVGAFAAFMGALGARYPSVHRWAVWNEADQPWLFPLPADARGPPGTAYRQVFLAAQGALVASGHPRREVLIGETSPDPTDPGMKFFRDVLCLTPRGRAQCAPITAAGWAHHPYNIARRPWFTTSYLAPADLPKLNRLLRRAAQAGATTTKLPIYITEFGVRERQANLLAGSEWVLSHYPFVRSFAQYTLEDDWPWFPVGLYSTDGAPKAALAPFTHPLFVIRRRGRAVLWGSLRNQPGPALVTVIDRGVPVRQLRIRPDAGGYFKHSMLWAPGRRWTIAGSPPVPAFNLR